MHFSGHKLQDLEGSNRIRSKYTHFCAMIWLVRVICVCSWAAGKKSCAWSSTMSVKFPRSVKVLSSWPIHSWNLPDSCWMKLEWSLAWQSNSWSVMTCYCIKHYLKHLVQTKEQSFFFYDYMLIFKWMLLLASVASLHSTHQPSQYGWWLPVDSQWRKENQQARQDWTHLQKYR